MTSNRTRIVTYLEPDLGDLVGKTAKALGQSRSALAAEVLQAAAPVLEVMLDLGQTLQSAPERHREALAALAVSMGPIREAALADLAALEELTAGPPPSNTGVRNG